MDYESDLKQFEVTFAGRLDEEILRDALSYVDYGECTLALETLCDQLYEYGVQISSDEYAALEKLVVPLNADLERVTLLRKFIQEG